MARMPYLTSIQRTMRTDAEFRGLNQTLAAVSGEFADMVNASCRCYPAVTARKPRGTTETTLEKPNGLIHKNKLFWVDGTKCFYDGTEIAGLTVTDGKKQLVGMGAYICIFPDKKIYNTHTGEISAINATYTQSGTITFEPLTTGSVFTKITATGIGNVFRVHDGVTISGCTDDRFNTTKVITDIGTDYIVVTASISDTFTQLTGLTFARTAPDMDYVCEHNNRLWGCSSSSHEIYASKLGDPLNWNVFEGISTDSYALTVGSDGDFTGCISHMNHVLFFKENTIHLMYGERPSNFALNTSDLPGVRKGCSESLEIVNETLYFVGRNGVYAYDGAVPVKISNNMTAEITDAVCTQEDGRLYMSCKMDGKQTVLVYDPRLRMWDKEDDEVFLLTAYGDGKGYFVNSDKKLCTITGNDTDKIAWSVESGDIKEGDVFEKYISKLMFNFWLAKDTAAMVFVRYDDSPVWIRKGSVTATRDTLYTIPITPQRCSKYRYKIEFTGDGKLISHARYVERGTELNGTVQHGYRVT